MTYLPRSWWTDAPPGGHPTPHSQYLGLVVHHTVIVMPDYDGDGFTAGDLDDVRRYMLKLRDARPDLAYQGVNEVPYSFVTFPGTHWNHGIVVEGRGPGRTGAHTLGFNSTRYGVAHAGNSSTEAISDGEVEAIREVGRRLWDPLGAVRAKGHRDLRATACPGDSLYGRLGEVQPPYFPLPATPPVVVHQEDDMDTPRVIRNPATGELALPQPNERGRWRFVTEAAAKDAVACGLARAYPDGAPWADVSEEVFAMLPPVPGSPPIG